MGLISSLQYWARNKPWLGRRVLSAIPDVHYRINVQYVGRFEILTRKHRGYWLRSPLLNDGFMLAAIERLLPRRGVIYDIGANIGLYCRFIAQHFDPGRIYAFEPVEENCRLLAKNIEIGKCADKVILVPSAAGDEDGMVRFQMDDLTSYSGTLSMVTNGRPSASREQYGMKPLERLVKVTRLDTAVRELHMNLPDVIKMDIEGAEAMALRGAETLLRDRGPSLTIELHGASVAREVLGILWSFSYHCFGYLDTSDGKHVYKEIDKMDLTNITDLYSLHYLAASLRKDDLQDPLREDIWV